MRASRPLAVAVVLLGALAVAHGFNASEPVTTTDVPTVNGTVGSTYSNAYLNATAASQKFYLPPKPATLSGAANPAPPAPAPSYSNTTSNATAGAQLLASAPAPEPAKAAVGRGFALAPAASLAALKQIDPGAPALAPAQPLADQAKIEQASGFVTTSGTNFVLNGQIQKLAGSNGYFLPFRDYLTDFQIDQYFQTMAGLGINVVRTWGFCNACGPNRNIQTAPGVFDPAGLQRLDLILASAGNYGIKVIFPFVNFWADLGGMQWYLDNVLGTGHNIEEFYTNPTVKQAYKDYVFAIMTRTNSITGVQYLNDPAIFAVELANEPATTDNYELSQGMTPGGLVNAWAQEMATYIRSIDPNHMISPGGQGFRSDLLESTWYNNGVTGEDYVGLMKIPEISFGTVHFYPQPWGFPANVVEQFANTFLTDRANAAAAVGKPWILEETGCNGEYDIPLSVYYSYVFTAALQLNAALLQPWELVPFYVPPGFNNIDGGFAFGYSAIAFGPMSNMIASQGAMTAECNAPGGCPGVTPPCTCFDNPPTADYSCTQQMEWHPPGSATPMCSSSWGGPGTCDITCGRCKPCQNYNYCGAQCQDVPPEGSSASCAQQLAWHPRGSFTYLCNQDWAPQGICDVTCNRCQPCPTFQTPYCQVNVQVGPIWQQGNLHYAKLQMYLTSPQNTTTISTPYTVSIAGSGAGYHAASPWEWQTDVKGGVLTGLVSNSYDTLLADAGIDAEIGAIVSGSNAQDLIPTKATINNVQCGMVTSDWYGGI